MFYLITILGIVIAIAFGILTSLKIDRHCRDE